MLSLGIIGFGNFTKFMIPHIRPYVSELLISSRRDITEEAAMLSCRQADILEVCHSDIVIIATMAQYFEQTVQEIAPLLLPNTLVLDVCSVKIKPTEMMREYLPQHVEIIGTHPLFGPESGKNGISGLKIALCDIRSSRIHEVARFCREELGLSVLICTPEEHDRQMSYVQGLTHFIGTALAHIKIPTCPLSTPTYDHLCRMVDVVKNDSPELLQTLEQENPLAQDVRIEFMDKLRELDNQFS